MGSWIFDLAMVSVAVAVMGFVLYKLMFSAKEEARRELHLQPKPRFERREPERTDRRMRRQPPPSGIERRVNQRR